MNENLNGHVGHGKKTKNTLSQANMFRLCKILEGIGEKGVAGMTRTQIFGIAKKNFDFPITEHNVSGALSVLGWKTLRHNAAVTAAETRSENGTSIYLKSEMVKLRNDYEVLRNEVHELIQRVDAVLSSLT